MAETATMLDSDKTTSVAVEPHLPLEQRKKIKVPRRILHFSDGVLEEYSTDEEDQTDSDMKQIIDPRSLTWVPWFLYVMTTGAQKSLSMAEFCGEKLAWLFGITSPKYGYALEERKRMQQELEEDEARERKQKEKMQALTGINIETVGGTDASTNIDNNVQGSGKNDLKY